MCRNRYFVVGLFILVAVAHEGTELNRGRINAFLEILEHEKVNDTTLMTVGVLDEFVGEVFQHFRCDEARNSSRLSDGQCLHTFCVNSSELVHLAGGDVHVGVTEEQFDNVSIILLYYIAQIKNVCRANADLSMLTVEVATDHLVSLSVGNVPGHLHLHEADVSHLLDSFKASLSHEHSGDHHHEDQHGDNHSEVHNHGDHEHEEHNHSDHEHEEHNHEGDTQALIIKEKCLSADALMYFLELDHSVKINEIGHLATLIVFFIYQGYDVQDKCRLLPHKNEFINNLFSAFASPGKNMSSQDLINLMTSLGINPETKETHDGHEHTHDHSKRRRSLGDGEVVRMREMDLVSRHKREVVNQASITPCYTATQIMAIYDSKGDIHPALLQEMCPSLLSQKLFGDCAHKDMLTTQQPTEAERYGYSTIATAIICLCSVFGAIFIPCVSKRVYDILMSLFVGLAVGTLFSDAVLHLIPSALGVHGHGEEHDHDHGDEIVIETYIQYGLVIMAGLYFFYIVETFMSKLGGHSHSHESDGSDGMIYPNSENHAMTTTFDDEIKPVNDKSGKSYVVHADSPGILVDQKPIKQICGLTPVALMIILGDGIHNFADGLAIGASFTSGIATGLATSIAVVCHELPHELGDFAVLLESGLSFKKALLLNLASSLTAFVGLYVSLSITTGEDAQKWIFAVTSGMFLYIALVDLLPQLIKTSGWLSLAINHIGILFGFAFMLLLAIFEERIKV